VTTASTAATRAGWSPLRRQDRPWVSPGRHETGSEGNRSRGHSHVPTSVPRRWAFGHSAPRGGLVGVRGLAPPVDLRSCPAVRSRATGDAACCSRPSPPLCLFSSSRRLPAKRIRRGFWS